MPKPINQDRGQCPCRNADCHEMAAIRRLKNSDQGAQYLTCPSCGVIRANSGKAQAALDKYIAENGTMFPPPAPAQVAQPAPAQAAKPARAKPAPARPGPAQASDKPSEKTGGDSSPWGWF